MYCVETKFKEESSTEQHNDDVPMSILVDLGKPRPGIVETAPVGHVVQEEESCPPEIIQVINQYLEKLLLCLSESALLVRTVGVSVIGMSHAPESLLSRRVPDL